MKVLFVVLFVAILASCIPSGGLAYAASVDQPAAVCKYGSVWTKDTHGTIHTRCRSYGEYLVLKARAAWDKAAAAVVRELNYALERDRKMLRGRQCLEMQRTPVGPICHRWSK